ncbi:MAG: glucuronate isomerase [Elusimicrobia bacterium RIFOXYB2_FULL_48_7]|nr:MAG: glucuronate isomerase [Elusimicrobia bacterium RIFOXYB2_FULL_48_7]
MKSKREKLTLHPDRFFSPDPATRKIARRLYASVKNLPIVSPHGHVNPQLFSTPGYSFGNPTELFIIPDHYLFRMLYSQGIPLESLGIPRVDGGKTQTSPERIWRIFADNFHLFRGTPTGAWFEYELSEVFGIKYRLSGETAAEIYDEIDKKLKSPGFSPRALFEKFKIEVLATTDAATDTLECHKLIKKSAWSGKIIPTFRPDSILDISQKNWRKTIEHLSEVSATDIHDYETFIRAIKVRREYFKSAGATATDIAAQAPYTEELSKNEAEGIFSRALSGKSNPEDCTRFTAFMIMEMARLSIEDGLVMQLHVGVFRNHNAELFGKFGADKGHDIPIPIEFTKNLKPLLNKYGNNRELALIVFTLDETNYSRELAPLAGHYPAMKVGPAWWFHDSINGMERYRRQITETAGLNNTTGFVDDTRAFLSIPARHDLSRRVDANWIAGLAARHIITLHDAEEMIKDTAYRLAKKAYKL